jgi:aldose 1-epimerase
VRQSEPKEQLSLSRVSESGTSIAVISLRGGAICELLVGDFEIVPKFALENPQAFIYGHTLAPWPNRLEDGTYEFQGETHVFENLDGQNNKSHGLVLDQVFEVRFHSQERITLGHRFGSEVGYPFEIDLEISYVLSDDGLEVTATAWNLGQDAPFAIGFHPYFLTGESFQVDADFTHQSVQNERMLPTGMSEIPGLHLNQSSPELQTLDHCFFGASELVITRTDGRVSIEAIKNLPYFMIYRPHQRLGDSGDLVAVEPQSALANAFRNNIEDCILPAGQKRDYVFTIRKR